MKTNYEIYYDYEDDVLEIVKVPSKAPVEENEGKYGIIIRKDIVGNTVSISIPECDVLFGCDIKDIENFLTVTI